MIKSQHKIELNADVRLVTGRKVSRLRNEGLIPAVLYGKGQESLSLQVAAKDFRRALAEAGESTLVYLHVGQDTYPTIIHDVTYDNLDDRPLHADFYKVRLDEKIKTAVPVVFAGESSAVKNLGGILVKNVHELEVEALPQNLPHEITIDISRLEKFGDHITLKEIDLGSDATLIGDPEAMLVTVQEPISEEELQASLAEPTGDVADVEVVTKEKPAEEGTETSEGESAKKEE